MLANLRQAEKLALQQRPNPTHHRPSTGKSAHRPPRNSQAAGTVVQQKATTSTKTTASHTRPRTTQTSKIAATSNTTAKTTKTTKTTKTKITHGGWMNPSAATPHAPREHIPTKRLNPTKKAPTSNFKLVDAKVLEQKYSIVDDGKGSHLTHDIIKGGPSNHLSAREKITRSWRLHRNKYTPGSCSYEIEPAVKQNIHSSEYDIIKCIPAPKTRQKVRQKKNRHKHTHSQKKAHTQSHVTSTTKLRCKSLLTTKLRCTTLLGHRNQP